MSKSDPKDLESVLDICLSLIDEQGLSLEECLKRFPQYQEELQRLMPGALRLRSGRALVASDELRGSLDARLKGLRNIRRQTFRGSLVTNIAALRSIFRRQNPKPQRRAWMIPALISFLVVAVLSMSGLVASADAAGPGDFLFGLDTAIEDVRLSLTRDEGKKAELRLEFATERLGELKIEIEGEGDGRFIAQAITAFEEALAAIEGLLDELSLEQRAAFEQALAQLMASEQDLIEFEFELEIEDGKGELKIEIEIEGDEADHEDHDLDDDDLDDDDLDDDDLDDEHLEDHDLDDDDLDDDEDCDSSGPGSGDCEDDGDEDEEKCDSSGPGSGDCEDDGDEDEGKCDSSGPGSGDCEDDDKDHDDDDDDDEEDND
ncbi:MAG: hypothetical protein IIB10_09105 [Chloroflexi bacterium]|nr:hypothetical protein [Chloroflexota bacterium]